MAHSTEGLPPPAPRQPTTFSSSFSQNQYIPHGMPNYRYVLEVGQEPVRARMCGFGDKDRRPITPPPCVRLRIYDEAGHEINNMTDVDCNFFILSVDLWDGEGRHEQNLVMHPNTSSALTNSSANSPHTPNNYPPHGVYAGQEHGNYYHQPDYYPGHNPGYAPPYQSSSGFPPGSSMHRPYPHSDDYPGHSTQTTGQFTRNLIGSLTASAFRLKDDKNVPGIWFVLQDLSVRTEGQFKLKFSFFNLGLTSENTDHRRSNVLLNKGQSKVLATAMSNSFTVFSAKKFPGMIESTELSKAFAAQGIRIPVRHAGDNANGVAKNGQAASNDGRRNRRSVNSDNDNDDNDDG